MRSVSVKPSIWAAAAVRSHFASPLTCPGNIFTDPEVGIVGLTEKAAQQQGVQITVGKFAYRGLGRALCAGETDGFFKVVADAATEQCARRRAASAANQPADGGARAGAEQAAADGALAGIIRVGAGGKAETSRHDQGQR